MILVIDTSSALSAIALLAPDAEVVFEEVAASGPTFDLTGRFRRLQMREELTKVAVATGPGSFTGLRVGVSFGLGLAMGLRIPVVPLPTLALQAARSDGDVLAVSEAGRGRIYHLAPGSRTGSSEVASAPREWPAVGWLRQSTRSALEASGVRMKPDEELRTFGHAAARLVGSAREVPYGSLRLEYMQSFSSRF